MTFDLATVQAMLGQYQALQAPPGWTFTLEIVPGLTFQNEPAWATVESDPEAKTARVMVRDLAATPVPGVTDPWRQLNLTLAHELAHVNVAEFLARPTVAAEEDLVERWARSIVDAPKALAGIVARGWRKAFEIAPVAVRARVVEKISARASVRARGGMMDPEKIKALIAAIKEQNGEAALQIAEEMLVEAASNGAGGAPPAEPPPSPEGTSMRPMPPPAGGKPGGDMPPDSETGRKARKAMDDETKLRARQVAATKDIEDAARVSREGAVSLMIMRARTVDGVDLLPEDERDLLACSDVASAEKLMGVMRRHAGNATKRARAIDPVTKQPIEAPPIPPTDGDGPLLEGLTGADLNMYHGLKANNPRAARAYAEEAQKVRARIAKGAAS